MGVFSALATLPGFLRRRNRRDPFTTADRLHACRFEQLETRRLMAFDVAAVNIGMVYREQGSGQDEIGDRFEITFNGGAEGTQLTQLTINTDKFGDGLTIGDVFFDTAVGGSGAFGADPFKLVSASGIDHYDVLVNDGATLLTINFEGFDAGEKFVFTIDVDEQGFIGANAVAEGNEFEGSVLGARFTAPTFEDADDSAIFFDAYDGNFAGLGLDLPPDSYVPPGTVPDPVYTAGAAFTFKQTPLPISIAGSVFEDANANNYRDAGDNGIAGVTLSLEEFDGASYVPTDKTTVTDANGAYQFTGILPGKYRIVETQPAGLFSVGAKAGTVDGVTRGSVASPDVIANIDLVGGNDGIGYDFAETNPVTLSGHVYHDANNNGLRDAGEAGIAGVSIQVQQLPASGPQPGPIVVITDQNGFWQTGSLYPGEYRVSEVQPAGWLDGLDQPGSAGGTAHNPGDLIDGIHLLSGAVGSGYDFGELLPSRIAGMVHADLNGDCLFNPGEPLLSGVTIKLLDAVGNVIDTIQTDSQGQYEFTGLAPGIYGVEEVQPGGYLQGDSHVGSAGGTAVGYDKISQIILSSGTHAIDYNFCELIPASLSGNVHADLDGDCQFDPGEPLLAGVTVWLLDSDGVRIRSVLTDQNGHYEFLDLQPGTYGVEEIQPQGYYEGGADVGSAGGTSVGTNSIVNILLGSGVDAVDYNFCEQLPASISGMVHADRDGDCVVDPGEPLLAGVTVWLLDADGERIRGVLTDQNGYYEFLDLQPGIYGVEEVQPAGYFDHDAEIGSAGGQLTGPDLITQIVLGSGVNAVEYNFCEEEPVSLCGAVYQDLNQNGVRDAGEAGIAGVTVRLLDANGQPTGMTAITAADGSYCFTELRAGTYGVAEDQPNGYFDGIDAAGDKGGTANNPGDSITAIELKPADHATNYNFGELPPGTISGYVYQDGPAIVVSAGQIPDIAALRDGTRSADDTPLAGVRLRLGTRDGLTVLDSFGQPIATLTDQNGYYQFTGLAPGFYTVLEDQPAGYLDGIDTPGTFGAFAINAGDVVPAGFVVDPNNDAIVRISVLPGATSAENNFSEVQTVSPTPPPPEAAVPNFGLVVAPAISVPSPGVPAYGLGAPTYVPLLPYIPRPLQQSVYVGAAGYLDNYSWHLSVIDAGTPRGVTAPGDAVVRLSSRKFDLASWTGAPMDHGRWQLGATDDLALQVIFGLEDGIPVTGDFNGDGITDIGVFAGGEWFLDLNGNHAWDEADLWIQLGAEGDRPVTGDWDGDGKTDIGVFGPEWTGDTLAIAAEPGLPDPHNRIVGPAKNLPPKPGLAARGERTLKKTAHGNLRADLIDHVFRYGIAGHLPITGDWNGDGTDTIGIFFGGTWRLDSDGDGRWTESDEKFEYGGPGDLPLVGDFNGDGLDEIGVYRRGVWYIDQDHNRRLDPHDQAHEVGDGDDLPVVGDWDGDGQEEPGVYEDGASNLPLE